MATYKKNKKKMEEAILKLQQIKQDESTTRIISKPRDKR
jgi:hypothetical protein